MKNTSFAVFAAPVLAAGLLLTGCTTTPTPALNSYTVDVSATYRERLMLTPGHRLTVTVADVSLADAPETVLARSVTMLEPVSPPYRVRLSVPANEVRSNHDYAVRAEIHDHEGNLRFTTDTRHSVLTKGAGNRAHIILVGVQ